MQYETNQNTKLIIKLCTSTNVEACQTMLEIENYTGFMNFNGLTGLTINGEQYDCNYNASNHLRSYLEFIDNKPVLTLYVYYKH
jgi:hypothetical protein